MDYVTSGLQFWFLFSPKLQQPNLVIVKVFIVLLDRRFSMYNFFFFQKALKSTSTCRFCIRAVQVTAVSS